jgi:hypothetical protein
MTGKKVRVGASAWIAALAMVALCGCGSGSESASDAEVDAAGSDSASAEASAEAEASEKAEAQAAKEKALQLHNDCADLTEPLRNELEGINSRLSVGLQFADYGERVGDARVQYDRLVKEIKRPAFALGDCLESATKLESALIAYGNAYNTWNDCIGNYYCSIDDDATDGKLQDAWARATKELAKSERELRLLRRP